jgi:hypothetical protein
MNVLTVQWSSSTYALVCCLLVTIRGLVGPSNWYQDRSFFTGSDQRVERDEEANLLCASLHPKLQLVVVEKTGGIIRLET